VLADPPEFSPLAPPPPQVVGQGDVFTVGAQVGGATVTTTSEAMGARQNSSVLSYSEKGCTFRHREETHDYVWRQLDVYGLPRKCPDYSYEVLEQMVSRCLG
jgi:hypothetical protein